MQPFIHNNYGWAPNPEKLQFGCWWACVVVCTVSCGEVLVFICATFFECVASTTVMVVLILPNSERRKISIARLRARRPLKMQTSCPHPPRVSQGQGNGETDLRHVLLARPTDQHRPLGATTGRRGRAEGERGHEQTYAPACRTKALLWIGKFETWPRSSVVIASLPHCRGWLWSAAGSGSSGGPNNRDQPKAADGDLGRYPS